MKRRFQLIALCLVIGGPAFAHNTNINLTPQYSTGTNPENGGISAFQYAYGADSVSPILVNIDSGIADPCATSSHTGCFSDNSAYTDGWFNGTRPLLGNSHNVTSTVWDGVFYVAAPSVVTLNVTNYAATGKPGTGLNPAMSLYSGLLYTSSHDEVGSDPSNSGDFDHFDNFVTRVSRSDAAPNDPAIRSQYYDAAGNSLANLDWQRSFSQIVAEGGQDPAYQAVGGGDRYNAANLAVLAAQFPDMTPEQWYALNYTPHNGYRDVLNYTTTGGLADAGDPNHPFEGQFDAFGDWSMGDSHDPALNNVNFAGAHVATLHYIASVSNGDCNGPNCADTYLSVPGYGEVLTGGHINSGLSDPSSETMTVYLAEGWYTLWSGGNRTDGYTPQSEYQTVTLDVHNLTAVPLPGGGALFSTALPLLVRLKRKPRS
ncbi:hypothetical protein HC024_10405 [Methylococcaceae bacterium WWC4]|nr:hypothetical protein [Methylococcaceae bacterium WWC4]